MTLLDLPDELLSHIASELSALDILRLQRVCSRFDDVVNSNTSLQYIIDLYIAAMVDNHASRLVPAERSRILRAKEDAWRTLDLSDTEVLPLQHHPSGIYDLTGAVLLLGERKYPASETGTDRVRTVSLQSAFQHDPSSPLWSTIDVGKQVVDVGLAIQEHDLIAVVTYTYVEEAHLWASIDIHLIQHSTGQPHPAAQQPILHYDNIHYLPGHCSVMLEVSGDTLCFMLNNYFPFVAADPVTLVIYNWKTGHPKVGQKRLYSDPTMFNSFILLSPDTVAFPIVPTHSLEICHFANEFAAPSPAPQKAEGPQWPVEVPVLQTTCVLELPTLQPGAIVLRMMCRCEPNPRGPLSSTSHTDSRTPFYSNPATSVMILHIHIRLPLGSTRVYTMIMHRSSLVKLFEKALKSQRDKAASPPPRPSPWVCELPEPDSMEELDEPTHAPRDGPRIPFRNVGNDFDEDEEENVVTIPWADWGPATTRWFYDEPPGTRWITTTCGQRFVRVRNDGRLYMYDFNQLSMKWYMHSRAVMGDPVGSRPGESVVGADEEEHPQVAPHPEQEEDELVDGDDGDDDEDVDNDAVGDVGDNAALVNGEPSSSSMSQHCSGGDVETVDPKRQMRFVFGKTVIRDLSAWEEQLESSLPFVETSVRVSEQYPSALLDEDIIVGLKMDALRRHITGVVLHRIGGSLR